MIRSCINLLFGVVTLSMLVACGGGGGGSVPTGGIDDGVRATILTGQFIDSPVEGLGYVSGNTQGITDASGTFEYEEGQPITFKVGDIVLGALNGKSIVTPLDLARVSVNDPAIGTDHPIVINIVRFLMTITGAGINDASMVISQSVRNSCLGKSIEFNQAIESFSIPNGITLNATVDAADAQSHFNNSMYNLSTNKYFVAQWIFGNGVSARAESSVVSLENGYALAGSEQMHYLKDVSNNIEIGMNDEGRISSNGDIFITVDTVSADGELASRIGVKKSSGKNNASLVGNYYITGASYDGIYDAISAESISFNGNGVVVIESTSYVYSVSSDGSFVINVPNKRLNGQISPDGNTFVLIDTTFDSSILNNQDGIYVGIKQPSNVDNTVLMGSYRLTMINQYSNNFRDSSLINLSANGSGSATAITVNHSQNETGGGVVPYSITSTGLLSFGDLAGVVSQDGSVFVMVEKDIINPDGRVGFSVGLK